MAPNEREKKSINPTKRFEDLRPENNKQQERRKKEKKIIVNKNPGPFSVFGELLGLGSEDEKGVNCANISLRWLAQALIKLDWEWKSASSSSLDGWLALRISLQAQIWQTWPHQARPDQQPPSNHKKERTNEPRLLACYSRSNRGTNDDDDDYLAIKMIYSIKKRREEAEKKPRNKQQFVRSLTRFIRGSNLLLSNEASAKFPLRLEQKQQHKKHETAQKT